MYLPSGPDWIWPSYDAIALERTESTEPSWEPAEFFTGPPIYQTLPTLPAFRLAV